MTPPPRTPSRAVPRIERLRSRPWYLLPIAVLLLMAIASYGLGDPRPMLVLLWWLGAATVLAGVAVGVIAGIGGLLLGVRAYRRDRRPGEPPAGTGAPPEAGP